MSRRNATPEQIAKAKEKRAKVRELAKQIAKMSEAERTALVKDWPTTIEGHAVSIKNACLLAYQGRATVIGGFRQWKKAGRFVRKGESGMSIWIPLLKKQTNGDEINEDGERPNFGLATVFDISQTDEGNAAERLTETEAAANMAGAYITTPEGLTHCVEHISEREPEFALAEQPF